MGWKDLIKDFIPTRTYKVLARHTQSVVMALLCFWLTAELAKKLFPTGFLHDAIGTLEGFGLILILAWFFIELFIELYKGRHNGGTHSILVA
jgi:hypothetical protein